MRSRRRTGTELETVDWCQSSNHDMEILEMMTCAGDDTEDSETVEETSETEKMSSCWFDPAPAVGT